MCRDQALGRKVRHPMMAKVGGRPTHVPKSALLGVLLCACENEAGGVKRVCDQDNVFLVASSFQHPS